MDDLDAETARGFRLTKEKQTFKTDGAVALSFAVIQAGVPAAIDAPFVEDIQARSNSDLQERSRPTYRS